MSTSVRAAANDHVDGGELIIIALVQRWACFFYSAIEPASITSHECVEVGHNGYAYVGWVASPKPFKRSPRLGRYWKRRRPSPPSSQRNESINSKTTRIFKNNVCACDFLNSVSVFRSTEISINKYFQYYSVLFCWRTYLLIWTWIKKKNWSHNRSRPLAP